MQKLRIFVSSPSDMAPEREKVTSTAQALKALADSLGLTLEVIDWSVVVPDMGQPEQVILNQLEPSSADIFIGILWHRFGTPAKGKYKSGTRLFIGNRGRISNSICIMAKL